MTSPTVGPVMAAEHLDRLAADPAVHLVVADVRWYLDGRDGRAAYAAQHLPGAIWVDLEAHLAAHGRPATDGRHPLPTPAEFAASMAALGIGDDSVVVAYDDTGGLSAGRLVVMLRMLGRTASLLDGGLGAWSADGRPVEQGEVPPSGGRPFTSAPWPADRLASADEAGAHAAAGHPLLDARPFERFTGEVAVIDPRPGHIPGARSAPWSAVLGEGGRFRPVDELRAHYAVLGVETGTADGASAGASGDVTPGATTGAGVVVSCGSGVSACMNVLAMEHAGLVAPRLFVASWSGWAADPSRPAETGPAR